MRRELGGKTGKHWAEHVPRSCGSPKLQKAKAKRRQVRLEQKIMGTLFQEKARSQDT